MISSILQSVTMFAASMTTMLKDSTFKIRPFNSSTDQLVLEDICKEVWNGTDYLPSIAKTLEDDESCDFVVMLNDSNDVVAVGNRRIYDIASDENKDEEKKLVWIEAIRTSKNFRGKGIATSLLKSFIDKSIEDGITDILSCTVEENFAMKKVFQRLDMKLINKVHHFDFVHLRQLPGWNAKHGEELKAESILKALNIEQLVEESIRTMKWSTVNSKTELNLLLSEIKDSGGVGFLPGLGGLNFYNKNVEESLQKGLIRKLESEENKISCVYALVKNPAIQSLKSKWVCCVSTPDTKAFESAIWDACSDDMTSKRGGEAAFALVYDGCLEVDTNSALISALPIKENDPFIVYSKSFEPL